MKKAVATTTFIIAFAMYGLYQHFGLSSTIAYVAPSSPVVQKVVSKPIAQIPTTRSPYPTPMPTPVPVPVKPKGQFADGSYTGSVADAYYGNIQVRATVSGGKLVAVNFLQYPNDRNTSRYINGQAMPILASEAVSAQSAQVDTVSGASDTSAAFRESLANALTKARA